MDPRLSVIVLGYGEEAYLEECLAALLEQLGPTDELVVVDNGVVDGPSRLAALGNRLTIVRPEANTGFAGGCNTAVAHSSGEVLVFVNSDAIVRPGAVRALAEAAAEDGAGVVGGCLRLADQPDLVNSAGNPLHFSGVTWAGACGEPAEQHDTRGTVAVATGGLFALKRTLWHRLEGFDDLYFAYHEDTDLCLRAWLGGDRVEYLPGAVADHHYEFSRNPRKMYLLERNRLVTVLTDYPAPLLVAVLPSLLVLEPAFTVMALAQGWGRQKVSAYAWLLTHAPALARRRAHIQRRVTASSASIAALMTGRIEPPMVAHPPGMPLLNTVLALYWRLARLLLGRLPLGS